MAGRYPYAPAHIRGCDLVAVGLAQEKAPAIDAGTIASHDVTHA